MEDNLERVLHCDDKEELRQKLALLQREYSRTVRRLQRAERSDAVRKHVRSRISEQNLQDQTDPVPASTFPNPALPPLSLGSPARTAPGSASPPGPAGDSTVAASCPVESENPRRRSPSIRFLLPVDDSCPRTPDLNPHRRSHSLRLRSRRSRLRWERTGRVQGGEGAGGRYDTETSEDGLELEAQTEKEEDGEKRNMEEEKEGVKKELEREENEREIPDKEAMKQSDGEEREEQRTYGQKEIGSPLPSLRRDGENEREEGSDSGAVGVSVLGAVGLCNTGRVLDSCTLVEGLPFPVEYYIRTTRRMASSQSHRVLCCSSLSQAVLCEGEIHMVVGMSNRRLVSSSYSVATTPLQVYTLTQDGRLQACLSLVCPTERVQTVAAVEGQTDALIGSTHGGHVVLWNVTTGQLLRSINLGDGFTDTTCLRGYSLCGVLFVLLQHPSLCAVEEEEGGALFSLVATNPLTGTVALATRLGLPKACTGRLVEVDVHGSSVIGVFRSGSVCVWQLGGRQGQQGVWFPELGCQLARWGAQGTVLTAHLNGDVCLHRYRPL
ncbi:partner and localizer of BRCA2 isoform X5 [Oncorhynchus mykiss]|uniref:partner and localizer of BRCA2 isoform X5 n=1 Tax=Oncorhynchus mykiss TaxID=8022 RepID=UPI001878112C|nr:partner and localizer of BRCA2 isoform X5 [Oncorhynchus mykiss]